MKTLLAVDVGNSNVKFGFFKNGRLTRTWRFPTTDVAQAGEQVLSQIAGIEAPVVVSSVVPEATGILYGLGHIFERHVKHVTAKGQTILSGMAEDMGSDRVAEAVAAWKMHGHSRRAVIVLGFGTANTLLALSAKGHVVGGWIAPGMSVTLEVLHQRCKLLPLLKMERAGGELGDDTDTHMRNGVFLGHLGLAKQWIATAASQLRSRKPLVVATGGGASALQSFESVFDIVDPDLTLKGIYLLAQNMPADADSQA